MSAHKGAILFKSKGEVVPPDFLLKILGKYPTVTGAVLSSDGELAIVHNLEDISETQTEYKDHPMLLYFGNFPEGHLSDDLQPFEVLRDGGGDLLLACCIVGDFSNRAAAGGSHSNEFYALNKGDDSVVGVVKMLYDMGGEDFPSLLKVMKSAVFSNNMLHLSAGKHHIILMDKDGEVYDHSWQLAKHATPWGWATDLGETDSEENDESEGQETSAPEPEKKMTLAEKLALKAKGAEDKKTSVPTVKTIEGENKKDSKSGDAEKFVFIEPPKDCTKHVDLRSWYIKYSANGLPEKYKDRPMVKAKAGWTKELATMANLNKDLQEVLGLKKTVNPKTDTSAAALQTKTDKVSDEMAGAHVMLLTMDTREKILKSVTKGDMAKTIVDHNTRKIKDPEEYKKELEKAPNFWDQNALEFKEVSEWPIETLMALGKISIDALAVLACSFRNAAVEAMEKSSNSTEGEKPLTLAEKLARKAKAM